MSNNVIRNLMLATFVALIFAACNSGAKKPEVAGAGTGARDTAAHVTVPQGPSHPPANVIGAGKVDTSDGTLTVETSGAANGTWKFDDVTAYVDEITGGGQTTSEMSFEAHNGPAAMHFRFRLHHTGGIVPGIYTFNGTEFRLDARWESPGAMFNSAFGTADGGVEVLNISKEHADGTFSFTLPSAPKGGPTETLKGRFSQGLKM